MDDELHDKKTRENRNDGHGCKRSSGRGGQTSSTFTTTRGGRGNGQRNRNVLSSFHHGVARRDLPATMVTRFGQRGSASGSSRNHAYTNFNNFGGHSRPQNQSRPQNRPFTKAVNAKECKRRSEIPVFGFKRLYTFLETPPNDVLLSINKDKEEWKKLLESKELSGRTLIVVIQVIAEKICVDIPVLSQLQTSALIACCSSNVTAKFVGIVDEIMYGKSISDSQGDSKFFVDTSPTKIMKNIYELCNFIMTTMPNNGVDYFRPLIEKSILATQHNVDLKTQFDELFEQVREEMDRKKKAEEEQKPLKRFGWDLDNAEFDSMTPPDNIKEIEVIPTVEELLVTSKTFLRPNKVSGAYNDSEHYLDVQFRLFREDFVQPVRNGVQAFLKDVQGYVTRDKRMPPGEIRLYTNVSIIKAVKERDTLVYKLQLSEDNFRYKKVNWQKSKRLLFGSLVILTKVENPFQHSNTHLGTVFSHEEKELKEGIVTVTWEGNPPKLEEHAKFFFLESEVYLEAYRHTLETLKILKLDKFPMKKFIVDTSNAVDAPNYLRISEGFLNLRGTPTSGALFTVDYDPLSEWPTANELGLDENQGCAFRAALTKEFSIIQGPPGTGKTFLGLKVAKTLLDNSELWQHDGANPITVVCYTNHALDQFLEGILEYYKYKRTKPDIIRIGGRCKSEGQLQEFTLPQVKRRKRWTLGQTYDASESSTKTEINNLECKRSSKLAEIAMLQNIEGVIDFEKLKMWDEDKLHEKFPMKFWERLRNLAWLGLDDQRLSKQSRFKGSLAKKIFQVRKFSETPVIEEREEKSGSKIENEKSTGNNEDSSVEEDGEYYDADELMDGRILDEVEEEMIMEAVEASMWKKSKQSISYLPECSVKNCENSIDTLEKEVKTETQNLSQVHADLVRKQYEGKLRVLQTRRKLIEEIFRLYNEDCLELPEVNALLRNIKDRTFAAFDTLKLSERWALYFAMVEVTRKLGIESVGGLEKKLRLARKELKNIQQHGDGLIIQGCKVVGLTTTGAAKYNNLLRMVKSKIVIVEEAAEVFEAHIVTCITENCEQLILIGDHLQLRPNPNVYTLGTRYNLNISLFERMVKNNLHCYQLKLQHRMRPEVSNLVRDTVYEELHDGDKVKRYPSLRGVTKNVFFISHTQEERRENDSMSKSNEHEASFLIAFCRHLILQGYKPDKITVLTMYTGQMFLLKKKMEDLSETCRKIRITCVDNFQGEENDIILLSLVRSNSEGKVGFVGIENRICVALSRARHGLYIIGNMDMLSSQNTKWKEIKQKFEENDQIGTALELKCQVHGTLSKVHSGPAFRVSSPEGGCAEMCEKELKCTHKCRRVCHVVDKDHLNYICRAKCLKQCANELHPCEGYCFEQCPLCNVPVEKTLPCEYQHKKIMPCFQNIHDVICEELEEKLLPCGHQTVLACHIRKEDYLCQIQVDKLLPCGHQKTLKCHVDPETIRCKIMIPKTLSCEHTQTEECWKHVDTVKCESIVTKLFAFCGHETQVKCAEKESVSCKEQCVIRLDCGHQCVNICHPDNDPDHNEYQCKKICSKECNEKHKCKSKHPCYKQCPPCKHYVQRLLSCGHEHTLRCFVSVESYKCFKKCQRTLPCQHPCPNDCFKSCGPCQVGVRKTADCGHEHSVLCGNPALKENCMVLVTPKKDPSCGHKDSKVPCKYDGASAEELVKHCRKPCDYKFQSLAGEKGCEHDCAGNCNQCFQGRIHIKCQAKCGKQLVCGHCCDVPCSAVCPPCQKPCLMKCEHSKCKKKCGEPCSECKEPCTWECPHAKCTKLCGEYCDRNPCSEPCPKILECGHLCIGFCGEPCPPFCRVCHRKDLVDDFFLLGTEGEEDSRFVYLVDCNHAIEVEGLEKSLMIAESAEIKTKVCPRCSTPIRNCRRFNNIIRKFNEDVIAVKKLSLGNKENTKRMQDLWISQLTTSSPLQHILPRIHAKIKSNLIVETRQPNGGMKLKPKMIDEFSMKSLHFIADAAKKAAGELLSLNNNGRLTEPHYGNVVDSYRKTFDFMLERHPLSRQEVVDFNEELDRIDYFKQLMMRRAMASFIPGNQSVYKTFISAEEYVKSTSAPLTPLRKKVFLNLLKELDEKLKSGLGITARERNEIVRAMGMGQGHWFKCPNGHIYAIGDCGGATMESTCNECGARIGGGNHTLRGDNRLATEMDGAMNSAWPTALQR